jgi:hypothetical protein
VSWPASTYLRPAVADYGKAITQLWALSVIAVAELYGSVRGGPYQGILNGLMVLPAIWALGPLGWPWLRWRLRWHRRLFRLPPVPPVPEHWRLPAAMLGGYAALLTGISVLGFWLAEISMPWWAPLLSATLLAALVLSGWEIWIFYAFEQERRYELAAPASLPHRRAVRLLRLVEGRLLHRSVPLEETDHVRWLR